MTRSSRRALGLAARLGLASSVALGPCRSQASPPCDKTAALDAYGRAGALDRSDEAARSAVEGLDGSDECPASQQVREDLANLLLNLVRSLLAERAPGAGELADVGLAAIGRYQRKHRASHGAPNPGVVAAQAELCSEHPSLAACRPSVSVTPPGPALSMATAPGERRPRAGIAFFAASATAAGIGFALSMADLRLRSRLDGADRGEAQRLGETGRRVEAAQFVFYGIALALAIAAIPLTVAAHKRRGMVRSRVGWTTGGLGVRF